MYSETVQTDRFQNILPFHSFETAVYVATDKSIRVPDMKSLRGWVRKHHQVIERPPRFFQIGLIYIFLNPAPLPFFLYFLRIIFHFIVNLYLKSYKFINWLTTGQNT